MDGQCWDSPLRHRYGLYLTDDGNTLYLTLDGKVMDTVDITGHFSSRPEVIKDGAYVTIAAAGSYQTNVWKVDDVGIYLLCVRNAQAGLNLEV